MDIFHLFITSSIPVIKMLLVAGIGSFIALPFIGILTEETRKNMNRVVYYIFIPCLVTSNLAASFTLKSLISTWFVPFNVFLTFLIGSAFGWMLNKITKVPSHLRALLLGCCASGNLGIMLLIILPSTCKEKGSPFGNSDQCISRALAYISLSMGSSDVIFWSYVYNIVRISVGGEMKTITNKASAAESIEEGTSSDQKNVSLWMDMKESFSHSEGDDQEKSCTKISEPSTGSKVDKLRNMAISISENSTIIAIKRICTPSAYGAVIGLTIAVVPPFRSVLIGESAPLRPVHGALKLLGEGAVPATTLIMGGNLVKGFQKGGIRFSVVGGVVIVRYLLLPLAGIGIIKGAIHLGLLHSDPFYLFVLLVQYALPPAMNMSVISQLLGAGESECSVIFLWTYCLTMILFPIWTSIFMWLVS